ncbi:MAG: peptide-methionine (S)-S-oxide reductase MsrA [Agarilytica sp.]
MFFKTDTIPSPEQALPGRDTAVQVSEKHLVLGTAMQGPFPDDCETIQFGMGCFWGAERKFWQVENVYATAVGYAGGSTPNATYEEVCSGQTGHTEVVLVVYCGGAETLNQLLKVFWESHDPTQGMRQGNDRGTQYRSCIYTHSQNQFALVVKSMVSYQAALRGQNIGNITTEIKKDQHFYYAEDYHQQYLHKNPNGYCGLKGTGVRCS